MWGLTVEEATPPPVEVWPEHEKVLRLFDAMQSQWRTTMSGALGFDYSAITPVLLRALRIGEEEFAEMFDDFRVMEITAVRKMRELRQKASEA